jgi:hypothetical protein
MTTEYTTLCCAFCGSTYAAKQFHTCTAFKEAVREIAMNVYASEALRCAKIDADIVRQIAREEIRVDRDRRSGIEELMRGNVQPAAQASAEKPPMHDRDPDHEVCLVCGVPTGYVKAAEENHQRWIDGVKEINKERDSLRAKLAEAEKALDELERWLDDGAHEQRGNPWIADVAAAQEILRGTGRLTPRKQEESK